MSLAGSSTVAFRGTPEPGWTAHAVAPARVTGRRTILGASAAAAVLVMVAGLPVACGTRRPIGSPADSRMARLGACRAADAGRSQVRWHDAASTAARAAIAWCDTVAPPLVSAASRAIPRRPSIAILSWNTHVGAGNLPGLVAALREGRLADGRRPQAIVLLLQEALRRTSRMPFNVEHGAPIPRAIRPSTRPAADVGAWAERLNMHLVYVPSMRNGSGGEDRGNAILSTLPLGELEAIELPFTRQRRVAVSASIDVGDPGGRRALRVVTAHFDTGLAVMQGGPARLRERSARALLSAVDTGAASDILVIGADLNTSWGDDEPAVRLLQRRLPDVRRLDRGDTWHGPMATRGRLDYLLARTGGRVALPVVRITDRFGSDHHPLLAWFDPIDVDR